MYKYCKFIVNVNLLYLVDLKNNIEVKMPEILNVLYKNGIEG